MCHESFGKKFDVKHKNNALRKSFCRNHKNFGLGGERLCVNFLFELNLNALTLGMI